MQNELRNQIFRKALLLIGYILFVVIAINSFIAVTSHAATVDSQYRECDNNAVMKCGVLSTNEVGIKYVDAEDATARIIFNDFGITDQDIKQINTRAVVGKVSKGGNVYVGNKLVASNAMTAGRQNITGSTAVRVGGITYYKRPPSLSFRNNMLDAFVVMNSYNQFKYAVLASCGNPVTAVPVAPPSPPPTPVTPTLVTVEKERVIEVPVKQVEVIERPVVQELPPQPVAKSLPSVGDSSNIFGIFVFVTIASSIGYTFYNKFRRNM